MEHCFLQEDTVRRTTVYIPFVGPGPLDAVACITCTDPGQTHVVSAIVYQMQEALEIALAEEEGQ